ERQPPSPTHIRAGRERPAVEEALLEPGVQPLDVAEEPRKDMRGAALHDRRGAALEPPHDRGHVAADDRLRAQRYVAQYRDDIAVDLAVDVCVAQYRYRTVSGASIQCHIAEDCHGGVGHIAVHLAGAQDRYNGLGAL